MNPLTGLYAAATALRNTLFDRGVLSSQRLQQPVVSVGNLSVGGSGKTPFAIALGELLKARGIRFDVLSRGYGRKTRGVLIVETGPGWVCANAGIDESNSMAEGRAILLPEETNDQSFVMTSSFSCMTYAALAVLCGIDGMQARVDRIAQAVEAVIAAQAHAMRTLAGRGYERVVYLGSHIFKGLAREAALKLLELTDGGMIAAYDSPLGFRHGPKTMVNDRTLVVIFLSNDAYTRRYDMDLLQEIRRDGKAGCVLAFSGRDEAMPAGVERILVPSMQDAQDVDLLIPFIAGPQIFAFEAAIGRGLSPDKPNISGIVNRVVQGVRIHAISSHER